MIESNDRERGAHPDDGVEARSVRRVGVREFERAVARAVEACAGYRRGVRVLAAVSGGADSVALLLSLCGVSRRTGIEVEAVNCNFHLRGAESDRDSEFVAGLCRRLGVVLHRVDLDVAGYRDTHPGESVEMACRTLRYDRFREIAARRGVWRIATGHNSDDNAETLLLNLMRGSGIRGLKAMVPDSDGVLRPLLGMSRRMIEGYLEALDEGYVTDSTNLESDYRRNFLRNEVFPLLESRWPSARRAVARSAALLAEENSLVRGALERLVPEGVTELSSETADGSGAPVSVLNHWIARFGGTPDQAAEMARRPRQTGSRWEMTGDDGVIRVAEWRGRGWVMVTPGGEAECVPLAEAPGLRVREVRMDAGEWERLRGMRGSEGVYLPESPDHYAVRGVRRGDRMTPSGMRGTKLVSDLLKEAGIPVSLRGVARVVTASDGEIVWLEGVRRSGRHTVAGDAPRAWLVTADPV